MKLFSPPLIHITLFLSSEGPNVTHFLCFLLRGILCVQRHPGMSPVPALQRHEHPRHTVLHLIPFSFPVLFNESIETVQCGDQDCGLWRQFARVLIHVKPLTALTPWASCITNLSLSFLTSKIELITAEPHGPAVSSACCHTHQMVKAVLANS